VNRVSLAGCDPHARRANNERNSLALSIGTLAMHCHGSELGYLGEAAIAHRRASHKSNSQCRTPEDTRGYKYPSGSW
jgi:hypothetical protein